MAWSRKLWILILSIAGLLFAGYLSLYKIFTSNCALAEPCPYLWGLPACYYGFILYIFLTLSSIFYFKLNEKIYVKSISLFSFLGILLAGSLTFNEFFIQGCIPIVKCHYTLIFPSCFYGLIFYIAIFVLSLYELKGKNRPRKKR